MADREGNNPRKAQDDRNSRKNRSGHRHYEENPSDVRVSRDHSQPITSQTQSMSVPDSRVDSHLPTNVDTNGQTVQARGDSTGGADQLLAAGSSVHNLNNKGPNQFGERNIINYNITNNHYHCPHQPPHHHGNIPHYDPYHCIPCLHYHNSEHPPLAQQNSYQPETQPQYLQLPHQSLPRLPPSEQQTEQTELSTQRGQMPRPENQTVGQMERTSGQSVPFSDVTGNVTHAEKGAKKSAEPEVASNEVPKAQTSQGVSISSETGQVSDDEVTDNVTIIDSRERRLMPGDVVLCSVGLAIYTGNQCVVWCKGRGQVVKSETLDMTQTFEKCRITSGECRVFPPMERVQRAVSRVGRRFTEGDGWVWLLGFYQLYFPYWVTTGLEITQARNRGFKLDQK